MKFISLFTKAPAYKRFNYAPRYYDPQAEEMKEREDRIRQELARERGEQQVAASGDYRSRITGAFQSARRRSQKAPGELNAVLLRLGILLFIVLFLIAFLQWGKVALYSFIIFIPVYIYFKLKNRS